MNKQFITTSPFYSPKRGKLWAFLTAALFLLPPFGGAFAQNIAVNTTGAAANASALLDIDASPGNDKGVLIPRVALASATTTVTIASPATSLLVYHTGSVGLPQVGYYYNSGTPAAPVWTSLSGGTGGNDWALLGNAGTVDGTNFIGTTDNVPINFRANNQKVGRLETNSPGNVFFGISAGANNTGIQNIAIGRMALWDNTNPNTGNDNIAIGYLSLKDNTSGWNNIAIGNQAMSSNTNPNTGNDNIAIGFLSLRDNTSGWNNIAIGNQAMSSNTSSNTGNDNIAIGSLSLWKNTSGNNNIAIGSSLVNNTSASNNISIGSQSLYNNTIGFDNVSIGGSQTLTQNINGNNNVGIGERALSLNVAGSDNTAVGDNAGYGFSGIDFNQCTFIGAISSPTVARTNVTMLGYGIGNGGVSNNNEVCIGNAGITAIRAAVAGFSAWSDARYKTNIEENVAGLDFILRLKPVTYNVRPKELHKIWGTPDSLVSKIDHSEAEKETRIGFVAQDVEKAAKESGFNFPGIDVPRNEKEVYSLRYVDFIMPMVKAMQEQQKIINELQKQIEEQKKVNEKQQKIIDEFKKK